MIPMLLNGFVHPSPLKLEAWWHPGPSHLWDPGAQRCLQARSPDGVCGLTMGCVDSRGLGSVCEPGLRRRAVAEDRGRQAFAGSPGPWSPSKPLVSGLGFRLCEQPRSGPWAPPLLTTGTSTRSSRGLGLNKTQPKACGPGVCECPSSGGRHLTRVTLDPSGGTCLAPAACV